MLCLIRLLKSRFLIIKHYIINSSMSFLNHYIIGTLFQPLGNDQMTISLRPLSIHLENLSFDSVIVNNGICYLLNLALGHTDIFAKHIYCLEGTISSIQWKFPWNVKIHNLELSLIITVPTHIKSLIHVKTHQTMSKNHYRQQCCVWCPNCQQCCQIHLDHSSCEFVSNPFPDSFQKFYDFKKDTNKQKNRWFNRYQRILFQFIFTFFSSLFLKLFNYIIIRLHMIAISTLMTILFDIEEDIVQSLICWKCHSTHDTHTKHHLMISPMLSIKHSLQRIEVSRMTDNTISLSCIGLLIEMTDMILEHPLLFQNTVQFKQFMLDLIYHEIIRIGYLPVINRHHLTTSVWSSSIMTSHIICHIKKMNMSQKLSQNGLKGFKSFIHLQSNTSLTSSIEHDIIHVPILIYSIYLQLPYTELFISIERCRSLCVLYHVIKLFHQMIYQRLQSVDKVIKPTISADLQIRHRRRRHCDSTILKHDHTENHDDDHGTSSSSVFIPYPKRQTVIQHSVSNHYLNQSECRQATLEHQLSLSFNHLCHMKQSRHFITDYPFPYEDNRVLTQHVTEPVMMSTKKLIKQPSDIASILQTLEIDVVMHCSTFCVIIAGPTNDDDLCTITRDTTYINAYQACRLNCNSISCNLIYHTFQLDIDHVLFSDKMIYNYTHSQHHVCHPLPLILTCSCDKIFMDMIPIPWIISHNDDTQDDSVSFDSCCTHTSFHSCLNESETVSPSIIPASQRQHNQYIDVSSDSNDCFCSSCFIVIYPSSYQDTHINQDSMMLKPMSQLNGSCPISWPLPLYTCHPQGLATVICFQLCDKDQPMNVLQDTYGIWFAPILMNLTPFTIRSFISISSLCSSIMTDSIIQSCQSSIYYTTQTLHYKNCHPMAVLFPSFYCRLTSLRIHVLCHDMIDMIDGDHPETICNHLFILDVLDVTLIALSSSHQKKKHIGSTVYQPLIHLPSYLNTLTNDLCSTSCMTITIDLHIGVYCSPILKQDIDDCYSLLHQLPFFENSIFFLLYGHKINSICTFQLLLSSIPEWSLNIIEDTCSRIHLQFTRQTIDSLTSQVLCLNHTLFNEWNNFLNKVSIYMTTGLSIHLEILFPIMYVFYDWSYVHSCLQNILTTLHIWSESILPAVNPNSVFLFNGEFLTLSIQLQTFYFYYQSIIQQQAQSTLLHCVQGKSFHTDIECMLPTIQHVFYNHTNGQYPIGICLPFFCQITCHEIMLTTNHHQILFSSSQETLQLEHHHLTLPIQLYVYYLNQTPILSIELNHINWDIDIFFINRCLMMYNMSSDNECPPYCTNDYTTHPVEDTNLKIYHQHHQSTSCFMEHPMMSSIFSIPLLASFHLWDIKVIFTHMYISCSFFQLEKMMQKSTTFNPPFEFPMGGTLSLFLNNHLFLTLESLSIQTQISVLPCLSFECLKGTLVTALPIIFGLSLQQSHCLKQPTAMSSHHNLKEPQLQYLSLGPMTVTYHLNEHCLCDSHDVQIRLSEFTEFKGKTILVKMTQIKGILSLATVDCIQTVFYLLEFLLKQSQHSLLNHYKMNKKVTIQEHDSLIIPSIPILQTWCCHIYLESLQLNVSLLTTQQLLATTFTRGSQPIANIHATDIHMTRHFDPYTAIIHAWDQLTQCDSKESCFFQTHVMIPVNDGQTEFEIKKILIGFIRLSISTFDIQDLVRLSKYQYFMHSNDSTHFFIYMSIFEYLLKRSVPLLSLSTHGFSQPMIQNKKTTIISPHKESHILGSTRYKEISYSYQEKRHLLNDPNTWTLLETPESLISSLSRDIINDHPIILHTSSASSSLSSSFLLNQSTYLDHDWIANCRIIIGPIKITADQQFLNVLDRFKNRLISQFKRGSHLQMSLKSFMIENKQCQSHITRSHHTTHPISPCIYQFEISDIHICIDFQPMSLNDIKTTFSQKDKDQCKQAVNLILAPIGGIQNMMIHLPYQCIRGIPIYVNYWDTSFQHTHVVHIRLPYTNDHHHDKHHSTIPLIASLLSALNGSHTIHLFSFEFLNILLSYLASAGWGNAFNLTKLARDLVFYANPIQSLYRVGISASTLLSDIAALSQWAQRKYLLFSDKSTERYRYTLCHSAPDALFKPSWKRVQKSFKNLVHNCTLEAVGASSRLVQIAYEALLLADKKIIKKRSTSITRRQRLYKRPNRYDILRKRHTTFHHKTKQTSQMGRHSDYLTSMNTISSESEEFEHMYQIMNGEESEMCVTENESYIITEYPIMNKLKKNSSKDPNPSTCWSVVESGAVRHFETPHLPQVVLSACHSVKLNGLSSTACHMFSHTAWKRHFSIKRTMRPILQKRITRCHVEKQWRIATHLLKCRRRQHRVAVLKKNISLAMNLIPILLIKPLLGITEILAHMLQGTYYNLDAERKANLQRTLKHPEILHLLHNESDSEDTSNVSIITEHTQSDLSNEFNSETLSKIDNKI